MKLRGEMQEMTLKYENQKTVAESLENIKNSLQRSQTDMQKQQTVTSTENEKLKRQVFTKEKLLEAQEESNLQYVATLREQHKLDIENFESELAGH